MWEPGHYHEISYVLAYIINRFKIIIFATLLMFPLALLHPDVAWYTLDGLSPFIKNSTIALGYTSQITLWQLKSNDNSWRLSMEMAQYSVTPLTPEYLKLKNISSIQQLCIDEITKGVGYFESALDGQSIWQAIIGILITSVVLILCALTSFYYKEQKNWYIGFVLVTFSLSLLTAILGFITLGKLYGHLLIQLVLADQIGSVVDISYGPAFTLGVEWCCLLGLELLCSFWIFPRKPFRLL